MKKPIFLAIAVLIASPTFASAQDVFASFNDITMGDTASPTLTVDSMTTTSGTAFVNVDADFEFDGFQFQLISTDNSVATITSASVRNTFTGFGGTRFNNATVDVNSNGIQDPEEAALGDIEVIEGVVTGGVATLQATNINQNGLAAAPARAGADAAFNIDQDLFQLVTFDFDVVGPGTAQFQLVQTDNPTFAGPTGFLTIPEGESLTPVFGAATLTVTGVPEPSSAMLLILGSVGLIARRKRA